MYNLPLSKTKTPCFVSVPREWPQMQVKLCGAQQSGVKEFIKMQENLSVWEFRTESKFSNRLPAPMITGEEVWNGPSIWVRPIDDADLIGQRIPFPGRGRLQIAGFGANLRGFTRSITRDRCATAPCIISVHLI